MSPSGCYFEIRGCNSSPLTFKLSRGKKFFRFWKMTNLISIFEQQPNFSCEIGVLPFSFCDWHLYNLILSLFQVWFCCIIRCFAETYNCSLQEKLRREGLMLLAQQLADVLAQQRQYILACFTAKIRVFKSLLSLLWLYLRRVYVPVMTPGSLRCWYDAIAA